MGACRIGGSTTSGPIFSGGATKFAGRGSGACCPDGILKFMAEVYRRGGVRATAEGRKRKAVGRGGPSGGGADGWVACDKKLLRRGSSARISQFFTACFQSTATAQLQRHRCR